ncbi:MAG: hypothetical protein ACFCVD_10615 [Nodosilinea sp.]
MVVPIRFVFQSLTGLSGAALLALSLAGLSGRALAQAPTADPEITAPTDPFSTEQPVEITPVQPGNLSSTDLSVEGGQQLMAEAEAAIANQDFDLAEEKLTASRETFNQLSNYYQELAQLFLGVDTAINRSHREKALETAQLRDQASYQLALVYRAQDQPNQAVPLLMEILRSQQPTRELGQQAYQQLFELGFVSEPYTGGSAASSTPPAEGE